MLVTHLKCEAHADISHNELVLFNFDGRLEKGEVDARGGVVAGSILMENVQTHGEHVREGKGVRMREGREKSEVESLIKKLA